MVEQNGEDLYESAFARVYAEIVRLDQLRVAESESLLRLNGEQVRRLDQRMADADKAVAAALAAAEKAVAAALVAAEKAVDKAEVAQQKVNEAQIENRGTLKDQARELMPRLETENSFREIRGLIDALSKANRESITSEGITYRALATRNADEIAVLRSRIDVGPPSLSTLQSRSDADVGRKGGALESRALIFAVVASIAGVGGFIFALVALLTKG